jgi:hypothetical protein
VAGGQIDDKKTGRAGQDRTGYMCQGWLGQKPDLAWLGCRDIKSMQAHKRSFPTICQMLFAPEKKMKNGEVNTQLSDSGGQFRQSPELSQISHLRNAEDILHSQTNRKSIGKSNPMHIRWEQYTIMMTVIGWDWLPTL